MFCSKCGDQISNGNSFCSNCGAPIHSAPKTQITYNENVGVKWITLLLLIIVMLAPLYPLMSIPLLDEFGSMFSSLFGSNPASRRSASFSFVQFWLLSESTYIQELSESTSVLDTIVIFSSILMPPLYIRTSMLSLLFIIPMLKSVIRDEANSDKFWENCMITGSILGISNAMVFINVWFYNLMISAIISNEYGSGYGLGFQLFKVSYLCALFLVVGVGIGIYARHQRKKLYDRNIHLPRNPQNILQ